MNRIATIASVLALSVLSAGSGVAQAQMKHDGMHHGGTGEMAGASQAYMDAMAKMDADMKSMAMTGKPGVDFAAMMIPHHQSAIDMARAYLQSEEKDPQLTRLSNEIIAAQEREIAFLRTWLAQNGQ